MKLSLLETARPAAKKRSLKKFDSAATSHSEKSKGCEEECGDESSEEECGTSSEGEFTPAPKAAPGRSSSSRAAPPEESYEYDIDELCRLLDKPQLAPAPVEAQPIAVLAQPTAVAAEAQQAPVEAKSEEQPTAAEAKDGAQPTA
eukprot:4516098-Lingulodinium_polyedra.AAC.1